MKKIGIVVAMDKEFALFRNLLEGSVETSPLGMRLCEGRVGDKHVYLMKSGIGKVAAATGVNLLCAEASPEAIVNSGVAGGIGAGLRVGDIVAGTECCYHDVDCGEGNETGQIQGFPARFVADAVLLEAALRQNVRKGLICTGDQFITDSARLQEILRNFPQALAVDMESAAMAQVCHMRKVPFLSLRIISDTPCAKNDNMAQYKDFWTQAPLRNFELLRTLLRAL